MGKKRRILAAKGKFGNKFSAHPRYGTPETKTPIVEVEQIKVIAKKIETIEQEVKDTEDAVSEVLTAVTTQSPIKPKAESSVVAPKLKTSIKKAPKSTTTKKNTTTKRKTTRKTAKN
jgi:uncharacterized protein (UPF0335 family)